MFSTHSLRRIFENMSSAIGIDLGTTFSCVAAYRNEKVEVIPDSNGDRTIPSIVYFDPVSGKAYVGKIADEMSPKCPGNGLRDAKRIIGRKFDDEFVRKCTESPETLFTLVKGPDDMSAYEIEIGKRKVIKTPEEVSAEILKYLHSMVREYLNEEIIDAVISIPAYFSNAQRKSTTKAAELAGLRVIKLITEPTAAAIHYVHGKKNMKASNMLVFDWGGGTLDVSLINVKNKTYTVKAVYGNTLLGGRNIDEMLFNHFYDQVTGNGNTRLIRRLQQLCVKIKRNMSTMTECTLFLTCYDGENDMELYMTREYFEILIDAILKEAVDIVESALEDAGWTASTVDYVVLVGGTTRIVKIKQMLQTLFKRTQLQTDLNPDEAVAAGAAIQAAALKKKSKHLEKYKVTEVTPLSLGVGGMGNLMEIFIPKNSSLPITVQKLLTTSINNQLSVNFQIFEGERTNCLYNNKLGEFSINGLSPRRAGDLILSVNFELDEDGILTVNAHETASGKSNKLVLTMGRFRLSERKVTMSLEEAKKMKHEDNIFKEFSTLRNKLKMQCQHVIYHKDNIVQKNVQDFVAKTCDKFIKFADSLDMNGIEILKKSFKTDVHDLIHIILKDNKMDHLIDD